MSGSFVRWLRPLGRVRRGELRLLVHLVALQLLVGVFSRARGLLGELALSLHAGGSGWDQPLPGWLLVVVGIGAPLLLLVAFGAAFDRGGARLVVTITAALVLLDAVRVAVGVDASSSWYAVVEYFAGGGQFAWYLLIQGCILVRLDRDVGVRLLPLLAAGFYAGRYLVGWAGGPIMGLGEAAIAIDLGVVALALVGSTYLALRRLPAADLARECEGGTILLVLRHRYLIGIVFLVVAVKVLEEMSNRSLTFRVEVGVGHLGDLSLIIQLAVVAAMLWVFPVLVRRLGAALGACALVAVSVAALAGSRLHDALGDPAFVVAGVGQRIAVWALLAAWLSTTPTHKLKGRLAAVLLASYVAWLVELGSYVGAGSSTGWGLIVLGLGTGLFATIGALATRGREPEPVNLEEVFS